MSPEVEQVYVVPRRELFPRGEAAPVGFVAGSAERYLERLRGGHFASRGEVEEEPRLKQIIPYAVVSCKDQVFLMRRRRGGAEKRLHGLFSLGVGGHINPGDGPPAGDGALGRVGEPSAGSARVSALLERCLAREVGEELSVDTPYALDVVGVLNDDSNPVGQVHFGVVYRLRLDVPRVRVREANELEGHFVSSAEARRHATGMESWSRHLVEHFWPAAGADCPGPDDSG
ncbi:MAG: hypothetical protein O7J95_01835 [Planctomycetota bacterium]|nr:hypothetical protein [Planctomycetota bacterium]